jgi:hypothetical protein
MRYADLDITLSDGEGRGERSPSRHMVGNPVFKWPVRGGAELGDLCPAAPQPSGRPMPGFVMPLSREAALFHGCRLRDMAEALRCRETCRRPSEAASPARR